MTEELFVSTRPLSAFKMSERLTWGKPPFQNGIVPNGTTTLRPSVTLVTALLTSGPPLPPFMANGLQDPATDPRKPGSLSFKAGASFPK